MTSLSLHRGVTYCSALSLELILYSNTFEICPEQNKIFLQGILSMNNQNVVLNLVSV